jgi:hypothetical protein
MVRVFKARKPGPTELTWEEKNSADYRYYPEDDSKLRNFIEQERTKEKTRKTGEYSKV